MEVFDGVLAQYGILAKNAQKSIEKERVCVFGNTEIETINIETLQKKGIKCLDIKSKKIKNITFAKDISLDMFFSGVTFTDEIKTNSKFTGELDFSGCTFKEEVNFQQANFENFLCSDTIFEKQVSFLNTVFGNEKNISFSDEKQVSFLNTVFGNEKIISFSDVKFLNSANFTNAIFNQKTNFEKVYFYDILLFNKAEFKSDITTLNIECKKEAHFINAFAKNIIISKSTFEKSLDLDISFSSLQISEIKILENLNLHQSKGVKISIISSVISGVTNFAFVNVEVMLLISSTFKEEICLYTYNFKKMQNINFTDITFGKLFLQKELFEKSVNFERCIFLQDVNFKDHTFNEITFNTCTFKESAYFNNSNFAKGVDFHECEFEKTACFYGVKFDETPNFSQALFKSNINIINSNLNFDFTKLDKKIRLLSSQGEGKYNYEIANDFRDSFRNFKSALIKDNNLLDASNFHKYELYCKEIELENKKDKTLKDRIDKWQLFFYRKLCDHHTDLLLNLRWLVVVVGFFVSVLFVLRYGDGNLLQFFNKDNDLLKMLKAMLNIKVLNDSNATYLILLYSFIGLFFVRTFFIFYYLVIFILMLTISPYNLFSVVNFVTKDQSSSFLENIIMVAYALIMILVLFSLQKTARKNSIVPS
ncbi:TPA: pentapeptide repeat-containing protein [Campylobacter coli]|nr:pentapeptide repeat-containing protein [Campylobacter coli]